jgi:hypothetical protein
MAHARGAAMPLAALTPRPTAMPTAAAASPSRAWRRRILDGRRVPDLLDPASLLYHLRLEGRVLNMPPCATV